MLRHFAARSTSYSNILRRYAHEASQSTASLDLVCYPYVRSRLKTPERRGWVSTIFARVTTDREDALGKSELANKFVEFKEFQESFLALSKKNRAQLSRLNIYFAPPANGRPSPFFNQPVVYDSDEYKAVVVPEQTGAPGELFLLPPLPAVLERNLLTYFSHADLIGSGPTNTKSMNWIHFLFSGSTKYHFQNWLVSKEEATPLLAGATYDDSAGWRALDALKLHNSVFFQDREHMHAAIYLGGRLLLHKLSNGGPVWISTFREVFELTGSWRKAHVRKDFTPEKIAAFQP